MAGVVAMPSVFDPLHLPVGGETHRTRGGWRMQAAADAARERERDRTPPPNLIRNQSAMRHIRDWASGVSSSPHVWDHMAASVTDALNEGRTPAPAITNLHACGHSVRDKNLHKNLVNLFMGKCGFDKLVTSLPDESTVKEIIRPPTMISMIHKYSNNFHGVMGADKVRLRSFWEDFFRSPVGRQYRDHHKFLRGKTPSDLETTIPCSLHQDAGPYSKGKSASCVSWSSLLNCGGELETNFVAFSEVETKGVDCGCRLAWEDFLADFDALANGLDKDTGEPAAQDADGTQWSFVMIFGFADCEQLFEWGMSSHRNSVLCSLCTSNRTDNPWSDLRSTSGWRPSAAAWDNALFMSRCKRKHPLMESHYWCVFFPRLDGMHVFDHHGTSSVIAGSTLQELVSNCVALGANQAARMSKINAEMKVYFDTHIVSSRMPPLRLKHLKLDGWGELHGPLVKAANTRHFMPFLQQLANRYLNSGSPYYTAINKLIEHANGVYHALYSSDMFLNDEQVAFLSNQVLKFGKYHMICRMHASNLGHHLFQVKPKAHYAQHIPFQSILINSRHTQCYCAESLIGKMTTIWKKSVSGPYSNRTVQRQVCVKYFMWVFILHGM